LPWYLNPIQVGDDVAVLKYDSSGTLLWTYQWGSASDDWFKCVSWIQDLIFNTSIPLKKVIKNNCTTQRAKTINARSTSSIGKAVQATPNSLHRCQNMKTHQKTQVVRQILDISQGENRQQ
jgi:hypothetical protein